MSVPPSLPHYADFDAANTGSDLIQGKQRAVMAVVDALTDQTATLSDTRDSLAHPWVENGWSGPAADAFEAHRLALVKTTDAWLDADDSVAQALETHLDALATAQDQAEDALAGWQRASTFASNAPRWYTPETDAASNAKTIRAQIGDEVVGGAHRAHTQLQTARSEFEATGGQVAAQIRAATEALRAARVPPAAHLSETGLAASTTSHASDQALSGAGSAMTAAHPPAAVSTAPHHAESVTVHPGDTLWAIAERELGDGNRWPEIYQLNHHHLVAQHTTLTNPNDIQPGWTLRLPAEAHAHVPAPPPTPTITDHEQPATPTPSTPAPDPSAPGISTLPPATSSTPTAGPPPTSTAIPPTDTAPAAPPTGPPTSEPNPLPTPPPSPSHQPPPASTVPAHGALAGSTPGFTLTDGLLAGGGVAVVAGGVVAASIQRRYNRARANTSTEQPIVRPLSPDLTTFAPSAIDNCNAPGVDNLTQPPDRTDTHAPEHVDDHVAILLNAAATVGVGVIGPGCLGASRALLAAFLASAPGGAVRMEPQAADALLESTSTGSLTPIQDRVQVDASMEALLDGLDEELVRRTRLLEEAAGQVSLNPILIIVNASGHDQRLRSVIDISLGLGILLVVQGAWPSGLTCVIGTDGRIKHVDGPEDWAAHLIGLSMFAPAPAPPRAPLGPHSPSAPEPRTEQVAPHWHAEIHAHTADGDTDHDPDAVSLRIRQRLDEPEPNTTSPPDLDDAIEHSTTTGHTKTARRRDDNGSIGKRLTPDDNPPHHDEPQRHKLSAHNSPLTQPPAPRQPDSPPGAPAIPVSEQRARPLHLMVLGRFGLRYQPHTGDAVDITTSFAPKQRDVIAYLAINQEGVRKEALADALWPDAPPDRPYNSFHATLSQMRRTLRTTTDEALTSLVVNQGGHYLLNPELVDVDLWHLNDALHDRGAENDRERVAALHHVAQICGSGLTEELHGAWLDGPREALRQDVLDALAALARTLRQSDPQRALAVLSQARDIDRHNEAIWRDIMRLQAHLGHVDAVTRAMTAMRTALGEIGAKPSLLTEKLIAELLHSAPR